MNFELKKNHCLLEQRVAQIGMVVENLDKTVEATGGPLASVPGIFTLIVNRFSNK
jgi:hypothetical protein